MLGVHTVYIVTMVTAVAGVSSAGPSALPIAQVRTRGYQKCNAIWHNNNMNTLLFQRAAEAAMSGISQDDWFHYRHFGTWSYEGGER